MKSGWKKFDAVCDKHELWGSGVHYWATESWGKNCIGPLLDILPIDTPTLWFNLKITLYILLTAISVTLFLSFFTKMFWKLGSKNKGGRVCFWGLNQCRCILAKVVCFRVVWCCQDEGWKKKTEKFQKQRRRSLFVREREEQVGPCVCFPNGHYTPHLFLKNTHSKCTWQPKTWGRANSHVFSFHFIQQLKHFFFVFFIFPLNQRFS